MRNPNLPPEENSLRLGVRLSAVSRTERERERGTPPFVITNSNGEPVAGSSESGPPRGVSVHDSLGQVPDTLFTFDMVAGPERGLGDVYASLVSPLASHVIDGTSCVVFVLGQSSPDKDAILTGLGDDASGLVAMATRDLLDARIPSSSVVLSAMEIHCEHVADLLHPYMDVGGIGAASSSSGGGSGPSSGPAAASATATAAAGAESGLGPKSREFEIRRPLASRSTRDLRDRHNGHPMSSSSQGEFGSKTSSSGGPSPLTRHLSVTSMSVGSSLKTPRRINTVELADSTIAFPKLARVEVGSASEAGARVRDAMAARGLPLSRAAYAKNNSQTVVQVQVIRDVVRESATGTEIHTTSVSSSLYFVFLAGSELLTGDRSLYAPEQVSAYKVLNATASILGALSKRNLTYGAYDGSLLTRMLRPYLGLQSHVSVVGAVEPSVSNFDESIATLKILGSLHKAMQHNAGLGATDALLREKDATIRHLIRELAEIKEELASARETNLNQRLQISHLSRPMTPSTAAKVASAARASVDEERQDANSVVPSLQSYEALKEALDVAQSEKKALYDTLHSRKKQFEVAQVEARRKEAEFNVEITHCKRQIRELEAAAAESSARHEAEMAAFQREHMEDLRTLQATHARMLDAATHGRGGSGTLASSSPMPASMVRDSEIAAQEELAKAKAAYERAVRDMEQTYGARVKALEAEVSRLQSEISSEADSTDSAKADAARTRALLRQRSETMWEWASLFQTLARKVIGGQASADLPPIDAFMVGSIDDMDGAAGRLKAALAHEGATSSGSGLRQSGDKDLHSDVRAMGARSLRAEVRRLRALLLRQERETQEELADKVREGVKRELRSEGVVEHVAGLEMALKRVRSELASEQRRRHELEVALKAAKRAAALGRTA